MSQMFGMESVPSATKYVRALTALGRKVTDKHRLLFRVHYHAPNRAATTEQLATWAGFAGPGVVNSLNGHLGHALCDAIDIRPPLRREGHRKGSYQWWTAWSRGWWRSDGFVWQMLPQVAEALEHLGWVD